MNTKKKKKLTRAEQISNMSMEQVMKLSGKEGRKKLESYVKSLKFGYKRRIQAFKKKGLVSHAQIALEGTLPPGKEVQLTKMTRNQLILEFARYSKFFQDMTSSEAGIKEVNRQQDIRIFGADQKGRPKRTMTDAERQKYWSLYEEYQNQQPTANSRYGSESIQQMVAEALFDTDGTPGENLVDFLDRVEERLAQKSREENLRSVPNVYSGRGPVKSD